MGIYYYNSFGSGTTIYKYIIYVQVYVLAHHSRPSLHNITTMFNYTIAAMKKYTTTCNVDAKDMARENMRI